MMTNEMEMSAKKLAENNSEFHFSRLTMIGVALFLLLLPVVTFISISFLTPQNFSPAELSQWNRWLVIGPLLIAIFIVLLGAQIDIFHFRGFTEWGALGAIVSYLGEIIFFLPAFLYLFNIYSFLLYFSLFGIGLIVIIIGYTAHVTALDERIEQLLRNLVFSIIHFDYKLFVKYLFQLMKNIITGTIKYLGIGLKEFRSRVKKFFVLFIAFFKRFIHSTWHFFVITLPQSCWNTILLTWHNIHWISVIVIVLFTLISTIPSDVYFIQLEIVIIFIFVAFLGVVYPYQEKIEGIVKNVQGSTWKAGYKVNYKLHSLVKSEESVECMNCGFTCRKNANFCPKCGGEIKRCMICWWVISNKEHIIECPQCKYSFHKDHWNHWIKFQQRCPVCRTTIDEMMSKKDE